MLPLNMHHEEFAPPDELRDAIKCFWYNKRDVGNDQINYEVIPDGYAELIFYFGSLSCDAYYGGQPLPSPFMMGLLNRPVNFKMTGRLEIIGVRCYPWTVFDLFGLPSSKNRLRIFEHPIAQLQPELNELIRAGDVNGSIDLLTRYFIASRSGTAMNSMLFKAGAAMNKAKGVIPVSEVANAAHATIRTLERRFKESSGHTVKDVAGLMRFEQVRNHLWLHPEVNLTALAHDLGYADQAHLSKEFKRYSGTTPAAFARNAKKGKQAGGADFVAFVQA